MAQRRQFPVQHRQIERLGDLMADRRVGEHVGAVAHGRDAEALRLGELRAQRCRKAQAEAAGMRFLEPRAVVLAPQDAELRAGRSEEHTSELRSLMRISYAVL